MPGHLPADSRHDRVALAAGLALLAAAFLPDFGGAAACHACGTGGLVAAVAARDLLEPHGWYHWALSHLRALNHRGAPGLQLRYVRM